MPCALEQRKEPSLLAACETRVLIVDDSAIDRRLAGRIVERSTGFTVIYAGNGREALEMLAWDTPAVIVTDMQMPEMDGLQLVKELRRLHPRIPTVLMTAHGSEELAVLALQAGAASYVSKKTLTRDLVDTLKRVLGMAAADCNRQILLARLVRRDSFFRLENDPDLIGTLIGLLLQGLAGMEIGDETVRVRVGVALQEALTNALFHGNLEVSSELRQHDERRFYAVAEERRSVDPYRTRQIEVHATLNQSGASFAIRDEGPGFDTSLLTRPIDPEDLLRIGGRGLLLMRTFMDEVSYNNKGNEVTMVKYRQGCR
jgi:CheY-like chemotaxis protein